MKGCTIGLLTFLVVSALAAGLSRVEAGTNSNASAARYGAGDLSKLSVPSGQLRALALGTASTMSRVPAALAGGDREINPSARHGSLGQYLVHLRSDLVAV
jgi:hypothetical protein